MSEPSSAQHPQNKIPQLIPTRPKGEQSRHVVTARPDVALRLQGLVKRYGSVVAVQGVSISIPAGAFLTLLGPSGSGKTTILNLIAGFIPPDEGEVYFDERPMSNVPVHKRNIGMVFQNYALFPHMNTFDNVAFPLRMRRYPRREIESKVRHVVGLVGLESFEWRHPRQLSGGQQQRVALARALVSDPPLLLMDEPLGALDKKLRDRMQVELKELHRRLRVTVVYVTHDQSEALALSDQIAVVRGGRVEHVASPYELYENPTSQFVADFIGDSNFIKGLVSHVDHGSASLTTRTGSIIRGKPVGVLTPQNPGFAVVRPERISCSTVGLQSVETNVLSGQIESAIYLGEYFRYAIETADGLLVAKHPASDGQEPFERGKRVWLSWAQKDTRILPPAD